MKTIARTLIILLAAGLIALGWSAHASTDSAQSSMPDRPAEFAPADDAATVTGEAMPDHFEDHDSGFSVSRVLGGLAVISGQTALVIALVALARMLGNWLVGYFNEAKSHRRFNAPSRPH